MPIATLLSPLAPVSRPTYRLASVPKEVIVGDPMEVKLEVLDKEKVGALDWIGIYPASIPTLPGLSHGRWRYLSTDSELANGSKTTEGPMCSSPASGSSTSSSSSSSTSTQKQLLSVRFPPHDLPSHGGLFEVRVHLNNDYGAPQAVARFFMLEERVHPIKRAFLLVILIASVAFSQQLLNEKGTCTYLDPDLHPDPIDDAFVRATAGFNRRLVADPDLAGALQALSSLSLDIGTVLLLFLGTMRRSSVRSFLSLFFFMIMRFVAQVMATIPCPPGYLWPEGRLWGHRIPSLFVDYHPANDFFFSGHTGSALLIGLELFQLDYHRLAWFQCGVVLPCIATLVVSFRVHRGIDVVAALLASIAACSIAKEIADSVDRCLQVRRRERRERRARRALDKLPGTAVGISNKAL